MYLLLAFFLPYVLLLGLYAHTVHRQTTAVCQMGRPSASTLNKKKRCINKHNLRTHTTMEYILVSHWNTAAKKKLQRTSPISGLCRLLLSQRQFCETMWNPSIKWWNATTKIDFPDLMSQVQDEYRSFGWMWKKVSSLPATEIQTYLKVAETLKGKVHSTVFQLCCSCQRGQQC